MNGRIKVHLQNKATYWKLKASFDGKVTFNVFKRLYLLRNHYQEESVSADILRQTLPSVLGAGLYSAFFVFVTELFSHLAKHVSYTLGKDELGLLVSTVVTVTGVFLGLYFTALSAVAGSLFMRAPEDLQLLFFRNRQGNQYIKTLVMTMLTGVYYLLLRSYGYKVGFLGPILITALTVYAIVRFMSLGIRTFYFIHPGEASATVTGDAARAIDGAGARGLGWKQPFLQNHSRKQAKQSLRTLTSLIDFGVDAIKLSEQQLVDIARYTGGLLAYYIEHKKKIPTESEWFDTKQKHQNWLLADSSELTMALNTGTTLATKSLKDRVWFENECLDIILKIFEILVERHEWGYANACIETVISCLDEVSKNLFLDETKYIIERLHKVIDEVAISSPIPTEDKDRQGQLAMIDSFGRLATGLLVGLLQHLDKRTCKELTAEIESTKWLGGESIYGTKLPGGMLSNLEATKKGLEVEVGMEGKVRSPNWYLTTITTQQYLQKLKDFYEYMKSLQPNFFDKNIEMLIAAQKHVQAAHLNERWLEFSHKMLVSGQMLQKLSDECVRNKKVEDLPWPTYDPDAERAELLEQDKKANDKSARLIPALATLPQSDLLELPDYFGQAYTFGVMAAYEAARENEAERLQKIFPAVLIGALRAHDLLREETSGWSDESKIIFSTEPLEDLLVLSGFIKLYSELYNNPELWSACEDIWSRYLAVGDARAIIQMLAASSTYRDSVFKIMPKATLRQNWDFRFRDKLEEMGLAAESEFSNSFTGEENTINHRSALIRVMARRVEMIDFEARTVFFVTYLSTLDAADGTDFPDRFDLERSIAREEGTNNEEN